jgi:hypothetical protein
MLERATAFGPWYVRCWAGILAALIGGAAIIVGYWTQFGSGQPVPTVGSPAIFLPLFGGALVAAIVSFARREKPVGLAIAGLAMGLAAPVVGWLVLVAAVAAVAVAVLLVIAKFH